jgi:hypothetical protein
MGLAMKKHPFDKENMMNVGFAACARPAFPTQLDGFWFEECLDDLYDQYEDMTGESNPSKKTICLPELHGTGKVVRRFVSVMGASQEKCLAVRASPALAESPGLSGGVQVQAGVREFRQHLVAADSLTAREPPLISRIFDKPFLGRNGLPEA